LQQGLIMTMWSEILQDVSMGNALDRKTMRHLFDDIMKGDATPAQVGALLMGLAQRGETPEELTGAAESMRAHAVTVPTTRKPLVDTCGTGGDSAGTFNISTASAFVVAGAGVGVAKHGNRSVSSACGSADVIEALGANIDLTPEAAAVCLDKTNMMFLFAPRYHPATGHAVSIRRDLGMRTLFNLLGPLCNPAPLTHQMMGIFAPSLRTTAAKVLGLLGLEHALVVHGHEGLDEVALSGKTEISEWREDTITELTIHPEDFGINTSPTSSLAGGDAPRNAQIIRDLLSGSLGPHRDVVVLNAGVCLYASDAVSSIGDGVLLAQEVINTGKGMVTLNAFIEETQRHGN
jgi:anthranilate phosphoribosyltransferase